MTDQPASNGAVNIYTQPPKPPETGDAAASEQPPQADQLLATLAAALNPTPEPEPSPADQVLAALTAALKPPEQPQPSPADQVLAALTAALKPPEQPQPSQADQVLAALTAALKPPEQAEPSPADQVLAALTAALKPPEPNGRELFEQLAGQAWHSPGGVRESQQTSASDPPSLATMNAEQIAKWANGQRGGSNKHRFLP